MHFLGWTNATQRQRNLSRRRPRQPIPARSFRPRLEQLEERRVPATFTVRNTNDDGTDSLRQAILAANGNAGPDLIVFAIPASGTQTILPLTPLPPITDPLTIDGYTQSDASLNTLGIGDNAVLRIDLDGTNAGSNTNG